MSSIQPSLPPDFNYLKISQDLNTKKTESDDIDLTLEIPSLGGKENLAVDLRQERLTHLGLTASDSLMLIRVIEENGKNLKESATVTKTAVTHHFTHCHAVASINPEGEIYIHLPSKEAEKGSFKIVFRGIKYDSADLIAVGITALRTPTGEPLSKFSAEDEELALKEGQILRELRGLPGIVHTYAASYTGAGKEQYSLFMKLYEKGNLENSIKEEQAKAAGAKEFTRKLRSNPLEAIGTAVQMLIGLSNIHQQGYVHNDIKPSNILLGSREAVVSDFGSADRTGTMWGDPPYLSPEFFNLMIQEREQKEKFGTDWSIAERERKAKELHLGPPRDVWAMGITLFLYLFPNAPAPQFVRAIVEFQKSNVDVSTMPRADYEDFLEQIEAFHNYLEVLGKEHPENRAIIDIIKGMLEVDPRRRLSAVEALKQFQAIADF